MHDARHLRWYLLLVTVPGLLTLALSLSPASWASAPGLPATIQAQIEGAPDGGSILILPGNYNESVIINKSLTVTAQSSATTIIQAVSGKNVISITAGHTVTLRNLTMTGGNLATGSGGGVFAEAGGDLRIENCRIASNAALYGGGVFAAGATNRVDVIGSIIEFNTAAYHGGGLYVGGSVALTDTQVLTNTAGFHGGGLHTQDGRTDLHGGLFAFNRANGDNGGAVNVNNAIAVSGTQFISNTAAQDGGALLQWNASQPVLVTNARFERNDSRRDGGGLWARGNLTVAGATFISNTVDSHGAGDVRGGALSLSNGALMMASSVFTGNSTRCQSCAFSKGGAVYLHMDAAALVQQSRFANNTGWQGGAIETDGPMTLTVQQSQFSGNQGGYGGALNVVNTSIDHVIFSANQAINQGGAIQAGLYNLQGRVTLCAVQFISNSTLAFYGAGGGALLTIGALDAENVLFAGNRANAGGAALRFEQGFTRTLRHITIAQPQPSASAAIEVAGGALNVTNTAIVSYAVGISVTAGAVWADYSLFSGGVAAQSSGGTLNLGAHNLSGQDPRFVNPVAGDYHLRADSPAIGAGTNVGVISDLDGRPRLNRFDVGAYQFWARVFLPVIHR